jgi:DNA-binding transcriptional MerR regulator
MYKTGEIAKRINVHENTVRNWTDEYRAHMSPSALGAKRKFNEDDLRVLATIADLREKGIAPGDIADALTDGKLIAELPPMPTAAEEAARDEIRLVPLANVERALNEAVRLESELARVTQERDIAIERRDRDVTTYNERIAALTGEIGELRGKLSIIEKERQPALFWLTALAFAVAVAIVLTATVLILAGRV